MSAENPRLSNDPLVRVSDYREMVTKRDRAGLASFIEGRFKERYFAPVQAPPRGGSSFGQVALSCLTIEALESFRNGWTPRNQNGKEAFKLFFSRYPRFGISPERASCGRPRRRINCSCFYHGVRCGLLHMGETTGGWRIHSMTAGPGFAETELILDATKLRDLVEFDLAAYARELGKSAWDARREAPLWQRFEARMEWTLRHCKRTPLGGEGEF